MIRCKMCGRELTDQVSVDRGIGPECIKRLKAFKQKVESGTASQTLQDYYRFLMARINKEA